MVEWMYNLILLYYYYYIWMYCYYIILFFDIGGQHSDDNVNLIDLSWSTQSQNINL